MNKRFGILVAATFAAICLLTSCSSSQSKDLALNVEESLAPQVPTNNWLVISDGINNDGESQFGVKNLAMDSMGTKVELTLGCRSGLVAVGIFSSKRLGGEFEAKNVQIQFGRNPTVAEPILGRGTTVREGEQWDYVALENTTSIFSEIQKATSLSLELDGLGDSTILVKFDLSNQEELLDGFVRSGCKI